jgi:arylsulfatase A-like enzyme
VINFNTTLITAVLLTTIHASPAAESADLPARPNILVFTVGDMDAGSPGFAGCPLPGITPAMDRLSKESVWFRQAHVPAAACAPSRHSMITGLHPHRNGSYGFLQVPPEVPSPPR